MRESSESPQKQSFPGSASTIIALWNLLLLMVSCGGLSLFSSKSGSLSDGPKPLETVIPPVPVTGSYLTSILMDENFKPLPQAGVEADGGQFKVRTDGAGRFALPVRLVKDEAFEVDVKIDTQILYLKIYLPVDIVAAVRSVDPAAGIEVERRLGIRIAGYRSPAGDASDQRFAADTMSLLKETVLAAQSNRRVLDFAVSSPRNLQVIRDEVVISGVCNAGQVIRVSGDVTQLMEGVCTASADSGSFQIQATLADPDGLRKVTVSQTDVASGRNVSQLLVLNKFKPPTSPMINQPTVTGLRAALTGTCDTTATSHAATSTAGVVRSVGCADGALSLQLHLPAGSAAFAVTVTSTSASGSASTTTLNVTRAAFECPSGYVGVPASGIAGLGHASAAGSHAVPWLNTNKDFCVMKYPAKNNNGSTYATSTMTGLPWDNIPRGVSGSTNNDAFRACALVPSPAGLSGTFRLISNTQWQTLARNAESVSENWSGKVVGLGAMARGSPVNPSLLLPHSSDADPYYGTGQSANDSVGQGWEHRRTHLLTNGEVVWDLGGNIVHWVSDDLKSTTENIGFNPDVALVEFNNLAVFPVTGSAAGINRLLFAPGGPYTTAQYVGQMRGTDLSASLVVLFRGGNGLFNADPDVVMGVTNSLPGFGFRCVFIPQ